MLKWLGWSGEQDLERLDHVLSTKVTASADIGHLRGCVRKQLVLIWLHEGLKSELGKAKHLCEY